MLLELIERTIEMGGNATEFEYEAGHLRVTAMKDYGGFGSGFGIASIPSNSEDSEQLFKEMDKLKKRKQITVAGVKYRLVFSKYESFGEWVHKIQIKRGSVTGER